jgi:hypothetical protein
LLWPSRACTSLMLVVASNVNVPEVWRQA